MFNKLFHYPQVIARHANAPLAEARNAFLSHLDSRGTHRSTLLRYARQLRVISTMLGRKADGPITRQTISRHARRWARRQRQQGRAQTLKWSGAHFQQVASAWFSFLGQLREPASPPIRNAAELEAWISFLRSVAQLAPGTVAAYGWWVKTFLQWLPQPGLSLRSLTPRGEDRFLHHLASRGLSRVSLAKAAAVLRRFLAYAFEQEWCSRDLSGSVLSPRLFRFENLPLGPSWPDVERLVAAAEGGSPRQLRNRAMLLLLAVYGLRSGEVRGLCLRDLDWDRRILRVHRTKTARVQEYPLTAAMSQALRRYLKEGRPVSTCPEVFLTLHQAVEQCIDLKRSLGFRFRSDSTILKAFSRAMGNVTLGQVKPGAVRAYLDGSGPVTRHWYRKWEALRPFYRFTLSRGLVRRSPLPIQAPKLAVTFTAYIYTQRELPAILQAVTPGRTGR